MKNRRSFYLESVVSGIQVPITIIRFLHDKLRHRVVRSKTTEVIREHIRSIPFVCTRACREHLMQNVRLLQFKLLRRKLGDVPELTVVIEIDRVLAEEQERLMEEAEMRSEGTTEPKERLLEKIRRISRSTARVKGG